MASIKKQSSGKWRARYRDASGKEHAKHFERKVDGQRWLDEVTAAVVTGQYVNPKAGRVTFRDYAEQWRVAQVHRPSSRTHVEAMLRNHAYPVFGTRALADVLPSEVQAWVKALSVRLQPATVGVVHSLVSSVFSAAVRDRRVVANPCVGTRLPKRVVQHVEPLTTEEVAALSVAVPDHLRALVTLAAGTGMRQGECFGLTQDRVDFLRKTLRVDRQLVGMVGGPPEFGPPKTNASVRTIPLPNVVVDALAAHLAEFPVEPDGLLFTTTFGKRLTRSWFGHAVWSPAREAASLPKGTRFHDLRHYYASLLIRHGESVKVVQARLGHASAAETLDTYSHLWPDSEDRTRDAVDSVLGNLADCVRTVQG